MVTNENMENEVPDIDNQDFSNQKDNNIKREDVLEMSADEMAKAKTDYMDKKKELENALKEVEKQKAQYERRIAELDEKEHNVSQREIAVLEREDNVSEKEKTQESELAKQRLERKKSLDEEISNERTSALEQVSNMISERRKIMESSFEKELEDRRSHAEKDAENIRQGAIKDADRIRAEAEIEAAERKQRLDAQTDSEIEAKKQSIIEQEKKLEQQILEYETKLKELEDEKKDAEEAKEEAERKIRRNERREENLDSREADLDALVEERWSDKVKEYQDLIRDKDQALEELRARASELGRSVDAIESFKASIGDTPTIIQNRLANKQKEIDKLTQELANRAPGGTQQELDELKRVYEDLKHENETLRQKNAAMQKSQERVDAVEVEKHKIEALNNELKSQVVELEGMVSRYKDRIDRLSATEQRTADREARIAEIRKGYSEGFAISKNIFEGKETEWLNNIGEMCDKYGISFPKRILYAFHTALKISDWSTIAVLAGVSGTGKSELPKLYAAFGGMNFISVPVQPSWDSQESMLGFFNSIDNRFEPEPLLKYLVQCTEDEQYSPYMSIVLLDEMNLAHVEHYFADFLSKLETRRGTSKNVPTVEVKLGAGEEPYELQLKRTVLWTGTMNQDETTKSLSDKVLDRGLVIYFPRPHTLISRTTLKNLATMIKDRQMLTEAKWTGWIIRNLITSTNGKNALIAELDGYREIVEEINNILEKVGRALGHRVWQSIMNYILNYPTVSEILRSNGQRDEKKHTWNFDNVEVTEELKINMRTAFEDQIVQKIMPKLRGIETRGKGRDHLQEIEDLLESKGFEKLKDDFEIACTQGYGQFMWSSAKYIEVDDVGLDEQSNENGENDTDTSKK